MQFAKTNSKVLIDGYEKEKKSISELAEELDTYPNKVRRALKHLGVNIRSKSEAQKLALERGKHPHPTKGTKRSEETKIKISESVHNNWENMDEAEKNRRSEMAKEQWANMSDEDKANLKDAAAQGIRYASKNGSKMEIFLKNFLNENGFKVLFHIKGILAGVDQEMDLYVPQLKTAIEIDGPAHFFPIWGEENLQRHIASDDKKNGLLLSKGLVVLRIKHLTKNLSEKNKRDVAEFVLNALKEIENKFPPKGKRFFELEVK